MRTKDKKQRTLETWMIVNGNKGDVFYSHKADQHLTAISTYYKRKITTERLALVGGSKEDPTIKTITKVTLI